MDREDLVEETNNKGSKVKTVLDLSNVSKKIKFFIYLGIFLLFIGLFILFSSMLFLEYNFYREDGFTAVYIGLLMIPTGLFFCTLGFTAIGLSPKDIDYRLRLGAIIASGLCIFSSFFLLFTMNLLYQI